MSLVLVRNKEVVVFYAWRRESVVLRSVGVVDNAVL